MKIEKFIFNNKIILKLIDKNKYILLSISEHIISHYIKFNK